MKFAFFAAMRYNMRSTRMYLWRWQMIPRIVGIVVGCVSFFLSGMVMFPFYNSVEPVPPKVALAFGLAIASLLGYAAFLMADCLIVMFKVAVAAARPKVSHFFSGRRE